ncbi:hypothetical protein HMPREF0083_02477 [Aneurinibacillus aneurinilyticus ATCC 12856]|uniref:Uncharacterized protein n=1 Tax=Aneurinibacillus aneurinilyticus ATCC 12856 TaxID=649747 RepID=U1YF60_ANEAE|nr:hypothetical protein HMPREF0083_02477 [Aneurinibacillus aneurinilyticus ATCC 12856]
MINFQKLFPTCFMSRNELFLRAQNQRRTKRIAKRGQVVAEELKKQ